MAGTDAFIWFVAMTVWFFVMLAFGTFFAVHTYDRRPGAAHFHLPHLIPHRARRRR